MKKKSQAKETEETNALKQEHAWDVPGLSQTHQGSWGKVVVRVEQGMLGVGAPFCSNPGETC